MTHEALLRKFRSVTEMVLFEADSAELARRLMALEGVKDFRTEIVSLLAAAPKTRDRFEA